MSRGDTSRAGGAGRSARAVRRTCCAWLVAIGISLSPAQAQPLALIDVPYISQSEALCGGAAAAMVLRYWGAQGLTAEAFAPLVDRSAAGIRTDALEADVRRRGFMASGIEGDPATLQRELAQGRPVIALIEDRPGTFHYVVVVAWHERGVVLHDPARAPFQVQPVAEFIRRWMRSERWMLIVTPGAERAAPAPSGEVPAGTVPAEAVAPLQGDRSCEVLVADGVRAAQANRLDSAEQVLTSAISCPGGAALRELAGVRLLQRRWPEVTSLAAAALIENPADAYAWKLLGTARFVGDDPSGALEAWNHAGEPRVDLVRVDGLDRTRQRVVERLAAVAIGDTLTPASFRRAQRQLGELPSASIATLAYVPAAAGLVQMRASIAERPVLPHGRLELAALGIRAAVMREVSVGVSSLSGGGERLTVGWRFWPQRMRYALDLRAPAPWGGVWALGAVVEEQAFAGAAVPASRRESVEVASARWEHGGIRWELGSGLERWTGRTASALVRAGVRIASPADRLEWHVEGRSSLGETSFGGWESGVRVRSSSTRRGFVLLARGSAAGTSARAPLALWAAGDTGHARFTLLRAHPVLDGGRLRTDRLGRSVVTATLEGQRWWQRGPFRVAPALFVDAGRTATRFSGAPLADVDAGVGVRLALPGLPGTVRFDLARGFRDRATALALVYEP